MATYEEQLEKARLQAAQYAVTRQLQADTAAAKVDERYGALKEQAEKNYTAAAEETEKAYRGVFDANAVSEIVARREAQEAIANSNMANSGLNNTQHTAISLMRGRADADTTLQKQTAVDSLMRELDSLRVQYDQAASQEKENVQSAADTDIANYQLTAETAAAENAAALETKNRQAALEREELILKYMEQGYTREDAVKYVDESLAVEASGEETVDQQGNTAGGAFTKTNATQTAFQAAADGGEQQAINMINTWVRSGAVDADFGEFLKKQLAYRNVGAPHTLARSENYQEIFSAAETMKQSGASIVEVQAMLEEMHNDGYITTSEYVWLLKNQMALTSSSAN